MKDTLKTQNKHRIRRHAPGGRAKHNEKIGGKFTRRECKELISSIVLENQNNRLKQIDMAKTLNNEDLKLQYVDGWNVFTNIIWQPWFKFQIDNHNSIIKRSFLSFSIQALP